MVSHARGTTAIVVELGLPRLVGELRKRIPSRGTLSTWVTREMHAEGANLVGQGIAAAQLRTLYVSGAMEKLRWKEQLRIGPRPTRPIAQAPTKRLEQRCRKLMF